MAASARSSAISPVKDGFTLIELAVVLVIIGLIAGGIMVGRDLIKAAEIRATITQYEKFKAAVYTFRTKYNGIPGDLARLDVIAFGLCPGGNAANCPVADGQGMGDNNGVINPIPPITFSTNGEPLVFWQQLSQAALIDASLGGMLDNTYSHTLTSMPDLYVPKTKVNPLVYWVVGSDSGKNYYGMVSLVAGLAFNDSNSLTPMEAQTMNIKLDDGMPMTGIVQGRLPALQFNYLFTSLNSYSTPAALMNPPPWPCAKTPVFPDTMNLGSTYTVNLYPDQPACSLRLEF